MNIFHNIYRLLRILFIFDCMIYCTRKVYVVQSAYGSPGNATLLKGENAQMLARVSRSYRRKSLFETFKLMKRYWIFYLFILPVIFYYIIFKYIPMPGMLIAFKNYEFQLGIFRSNWTGFRYFSDFLTNGEFIRVFTNTLTLTVLGLIIGFPCPIILALMLNEIKFQKYKKFIQTITYLPHFVSFVVIYAIMYNFFSMNGFINGVRSIFGLERKLF